jgi:multidrug efflux pump subunit AcrB
MHPVGIVRLTLKNPYLMLVAVLLVVVIGIVSLRLIPTDLLPVFKTPAVQIVTFYPGMPAEVMERDIMSRLERWTGQSVGIEHQEAKAMLGVCVVKDFFQEGISLETAMSQVTSYAMSDMFYLPPGTIPPMVMPFDPTAMTPLCLLSVWSDTHSEKELYDVAYFQLRNRLQSIQGVIAPAVYGGVLRRILAYLDRDQLQARGLDPLDVVDALGKWNTLIPTGNAKFGDIDWQLNTNGMVSQVDELNDVPILFHDGSPVYVRDVAKVEDSSQIQSNVVRINGRRQVYIPIYRQPGANSLSIVEQVNKAKGTIQARLPEGINLDVVFDQSVTIRSAIEELELSALIGAALAAVIIFIFLRSVLPSIAVLATVPLAVLVSFIGLHFSGESINVMTLGGMALAVGVMVDQAIVLMENVLRHLREGKDPLRAAYDGTREVAVPVLVSTLTFVAVFFPVIFLTGMAGFLFKPLALAVTFGMVGSYILAMLIIPAFSATFLKTPKITSKTTERDDSSTKRESGYLRLVRFLVARPFVTIVLALLLLATTIFPFSQLGWELFPRLDQGQFTVFVRAPSGTRIELTEKLLQQVEQAIVQGVSTDPTGTAMAAVSEEAVSEEAAPKETASEGLLIPEESEVEMIISNIGVLMDWPAAYTWNSGPMDAFVLVQLEGDRTRSSLEHVEFLREELPTRFPGVEFAFDTAGMLTTALNFGLPSPINIRIEGTKGYDQAHEIAKAIRADVAKIPGAADVRIQQKLDYPQIAIDVDREKVAYYGLTQEDVVKNIVTATNSSINFKPAFWIDERNGNHYFIGAQYREEAIEDIDTLKSLPINSPTQKTPISLGDLATFRQTTAPAEITHFNITRMIDIFVNVREGYDVGSISRRVEEVLETSRETLPPGFSVTQAGEIETFRRSFRSFGFGFALAAIVIYLILVVLFRSVLEPLVILLTVPLGLIGVGWLLYATGTTLNIQSCMGIILMTGLVVEYGILLVDFANRRRAEGLSLEDAAVEAARMRLRPILMTSLTTALALIPMAFFSAHGGGANTALARTILGGVVAAAFLSLLVMPALYRLLARRSPAPTVVLHDEIAPE